MERIRKERRHFVCALSPSKKFNFTQNSNRAAARMKKRLLRKRIKTEDMYLGFYTLRGRKFPHGNFRTSVFCEVKTQIVGKTKFFDSLSTAVYDCGAFLRVKFTETSARKPARAARQSGGGLVRKSGRRRTRPECPSRRRHRTTRRRAQRDRGRAGRAVRNCG